jgi:hypothetical protein
MDLYRTVKLIVFSPTGTTRRVLEAISRVLDNPRFCQAMAQRSLVRAQRARNLSLGLPCSGIAEKRNEREDRCVFTSYHT